MDYEKALRILAVLYVRYQTDSYINHMQLARACAEWLLPSSDSCQRKGEAGLAKKFSHYEIQQLSALWKIDYGYCYELLEWAVREIERHDSQYPQTSFSFQYPPTP